ncbi:hypothetical protein N7457_009817 [Penicillium paradoxum]|uniref:uncharacterized protein n=1 Tax=Penicillium paradoxum TaxID=176176 RepID=UPI0025467CC0|nr:uncharacterized protein N7457_009817 [Penicillium paradoxum]KAJ5774921.1 hypothetical protein N7457_009817 [Penicillium paradoxum]
MADERDFASEAPAPPQNYDPSPRDMTAPPISRQASSPVVLPSREALGSGLSASSTHLGQINAARRGVGSSPHGQASMSTKGVATYRGFNGADPFGPRRRRSRLPCWSHASDCQPAQPSKLAIVSWRPGCWPRPFVSSTGGLAAKRVKPGLKLSDITGPPAPAAGTDQKQGDSNGESAFSKYSEFIDTKEGTLNFKNKALLHGGGVEFSSGHSFKISLDEVDRLEELGKGNYGTVYKVRHSRPHLRKPGLGLSGIVSRSSGQDEPSPESGSTQLSGVVMAMKEIRLELDEAKFAQIIMELDILHRCVSPFIIDFYGAFFQEGAVYMCVEFMDGGSIDKLYEGGVPENILRKVTLSTIMGLKSLKEDHNIIHRDVKPTNILVNSKGQIKICDFGVSGNLVSSIAKTNIGCQSYMAPERIAGGGMQQSGAPSAGTYSVQSDIWSLGLSIIECAMGRYPYPPETFNNIFSQLHAIVHGDPPTLPEGFSEDAHAFVRACLDKNPKNRPTYNMLLRHPWLAPLMQPPTESGADSAPPTEDSISGDAASSAMTADEEVSGWVNKQIKRRAEGLLHISEKPALHAVALDKVGTGASEGGTLAPSQND